LKLCLLDTALRTSRFVDLDGSLYQIRMASQKIAGVNHV
jgi:hypothetical protein